MKKTEKKVIDLLIENPGYNSEDLAGKIGVTKRTIERAFKTLKEKKMIERIGSKRDGNWIVYYLEGGYSVLRLSLFSNARSPKILAKLRIVSPYFLFLV